MTAAKVDTIVHGGQVVTATEVLETAIAIQGEKIVALGPAALLPQAERDIDASGRYVLPGAIDCHIHLGPEYADDWRPGSIAAAHAGLTTLLNFALYDDRSRETLPQAIERHQREAGRQSVLDFGFHFILLDQPSILEGLPQAFEMGVTSFKMFMTYKKRGRMCSDEFICRVMELVAARGGLTQLHCENGDVIDYLEEKAIAEGRLHPRHFPGTCPDWAEEEAINRAITLAAFTGSPLYVVHLSTRLGLERIRAAQARGQRVFAETCPQYLLLTEAEMERWGPLAKIGPPLRQADGPDREALWQGLELGHIATIGSDHAARPRPEKEPGWQNVFVDAAGKSIPFGTTSVETMVPLAYSEGVVKRGLPLTWMARVLAENPARLFGLYPKKGTIRVGSDADLLIIDPGATATIHAANLHSLAGWTLFEGWPVHGWPWLTLLRGRALLRDGKLEQTPGSGRYLARRGPIPPIAGPVR